MAQENAIPLEETLDPEDWESMRALGHRMLDDMLDYVKTARERPAWQYASDEGSRCTSTGRCRLIRSRREDFDLLVREVTRAGAELAQAWR